MKQITKSQSIRNLQRQKLLQRQATSAHQDPDEFDAFNWEDLRHLFKIREKNFERYNNLINVAERNLRNDQLRQQYLEGILSKVPPQKRSNSEIKLLERLTQRWSIIHTLLKSGSKNTEIHTYACSVFKLRYYDKGQTIIVEGDKPDGFFYILEGQVNIYKRIEGRSHDLNARVFLGKQILRLKKKRALLKLRFITIIKNYKKETIDSTSPTLSRRRTSICNRQIQLKQANDQNDIQTLSGGLQLQEIHDLSLFFGPGSHLQQQFVVTLGSDKYFGELGILTGNPRARSVVAKTPCKLIFLTIKDYSMIFKQQEQRKLRKKITFFQQNFFHGIDPQLILKLHYNFIKTKYTINQIIYRRGDPVEQIYVIKSGTVELLGEKGLRLAQITDGNLFGESEMMQKKRSRLVTAVCKSDKLTVYTLTKGWFLKLIQENQVFRDIVHSKSSKRIYWQESLQDKYISILNSDSLNNSVEDNQTQITSNKFRDYIHSFSKNYRSADQSLCGSKSSFDQTNVDLHKINKDLHLINKYSVQIRKINHRKESSLDLSKSRSTSKIHSKEALKAKKNIRIKMVSSQFSIHQSAKKNNLTQLYEVINKTDSIQQLTFDFLGLRPKMSVLKNQKK